MKNQSKCRSLGINHLEFDARLVSCESFCSILFHWNVSVKLLKNTFKKQASRNATETCEASDTSKNDINQLKN